MQREIAFFDLTVLNGWAKDFYKISGESLKRAKELYTAEPRLANISDQIESILLQNKENDHQPEGFGELPQLLQRCINLVQFRGATHVESYEQQVQACLNELEQLLARAKVTAPKML